MRVKVGDETYVIIPWKVLRGSSKGPAWWLNRAADRLERVDGPSSPTIRRVVRAFAEAVETDYPVMICPVEEAEVEDAPLIRLVHRAVCPECEQGKCPNCTGEAMVGEVMTACECPEPVHLQPMENEVYQLTVASGSVGVTVPEIKRIKGIREPEVPLGNLAASGHVVRTERARDGWPVWVSHFDAQGPQIGVQSVEDNTEGTDMSDEKDGPEFTPGEVRHIHPDGERGPEAFVPQIIRASMDDAARMQPRLSALAGAKAILGEDQRSAGPLSHPTKTRPSVDDLLRLAFYIDSGIVLDDKLTRKASTPDA